MGKKKIQIENEKHEMTRKEKAEKKRYDELMAKSHEERLAYIDSLIAKVDKENTR